MSFKLPEDWLGRELAVDVWGAGGTGYYVCTALFQLERALRGTTDGQQGLSEIRVFDPKDVSAANLGRTGYLPYEVGHNKAEIIANKLKMALGRELFSGIPSEAALSRGWQGPDLIITATDSLASRKPVHADWNGWWLDLGVSEATATAVLGGRGEGTQLPTSFDLFSVPDKEVVREPSCDMRASLAAQSFGINQTVATAGINLLAQLLFDGEIAYHGVLIDLASGHHSPIPVDEAAWASYGWAA